MKKIIIRCLLLLLVFGCKDNIRKFEKPNIIYFLADDLGYGELGVYGQDKIETPSIDALAHNGMLFTQHYSGAPVCAPARSVLLTGQHMGHTPIRGNDEWSERGEIWNYAKASNNIELEGQRPLPKETFTLAKLLGKNGYATSIFGKWGLGAPNTDGVPNKQGFDYFFGYNCQRQAHNLYPPHLWENDKKITLQNDLVAPGTALNSFDDLYDEKSYALYTNQKEYAPAIIQEKALEFIEDHKSSPFFMYYATPLPHLPLQAPDSLVQFYHKKFGDEQPYTGKSYFPSRYPRATYAAMITYMDAQLGQLIEKLKKEGIYENTIIIFASDNGPSYLGGVDAEFFNSAKPFPNNYGRTKGYVYEGGIRVPMIASWPFHIKPNTTSDHISAFYDVLPTICDIIGVNIPEHTDGISFKNALLENYDQKEHKFLYWEFPGYNGQQAVRYGKWKGIRKNIHDGNLNMELYDLSKDVTESHDIAEQHPHIVTIIEEIMKKEHEKPIISKFEMEILDNEK